ncbi:MAG: hypothetical protein KZQ76_06290 [Candidatus Thiodiazotropha sp. (ex Epidulcina cf. delphinae)]|nr:hypothetical protein [Candidatus Thiodiazotropha sp. (ex Epidulcina cf. delphinae)]
MGAAIVSKAVVFPKPLAATIKKKLQGAPLSNIGDGLPESVRFVRSWSGESQLSRKARAALPGNTFHFADIQ